jgi:hypothetical protein
MLVLEVGESGSKWPLARKLRFVGIPEILGWDPASNSEAGRTHFRRGGHRGGGYDIGRGF